MKTQVDITEGITKQVTLFWCRGCGRYQGPKWMSLELESRELLALCLKKVKGLHKEVKLVDAGFVYTEPHSRRLKVKLTIQKEIFNAVILQQVFVVEFFIQNMQCTECQKSYTEHTWTASVQVRQKVKHKRTFLFLEQLLLKHHAADRAMSVKEQPFGLDFYFGNESGANHLINFLKSVVPIRLKSSKRLISQDDNSNIFNYKYTMYIEIAPISKDDMVLLEPKLTQILGNISPLMLVSRVTATITMIDPVSMKLVEISGGTYWHHPFRAIMNSKQLTEFVVLDVEKIDTERKEKDESVRDARPFNRQAISLNDKMCLCKVLIARQSDFGVNDTQFEVISHLGNMLKPGDISLGYELAHANVNDTVKFPRGHRPPEIILVRKHYPNKKNRARRRKFQLKSLPKDETTKPIKKGDQLRAAQELEEFMQEIEEDPELQGKVNLYKKKGAIAASSAEMSDEKAMEGAEQEEDEEDVEYPEVDMNQLLDDLAQVNMNEEAASDEEAPGRVNIVDEVPDEEPEGNWEVGPSNVGGMDEKPSKAGKGGKKKGK